MPSFQLAEALVKNVKTDTIWPPTLQGHLGWPCMTVRMWLISSNMQWWDCSSLMSSGVASPKVWRGTKIWGVGKMFDFRRITLFCLGKRLSKHKVAIFSKSFWGAMASLAPPRLRLCSYPLLCLQKQVAKLASGLFCCWSLLHNNNTAISPQTFTSYYGR